MSTYDDDAEADLQRLDDENEQRRAENASLKARVANLDPAPRSEADDTRLAQEIAGAKSEQDVMSILNREGMVHES